MLYRAAMPEGYLPSAEQLVDELDAFFGAAFAKGRGREGMTSDALRELFASHVRLSREAVVALLLEAEQRPAALQELAAALKRAADAVHPTITSDIQAADVLAYTLNTMADAFAIEMATRMHVRLPKRMQGHGDSLFAFQAKHS